LIAVNFATTTPAIAILGLTIATMGQGGRLLRSRAGASSLATGTAC